MITKRLWNKQWSEWKMRVSQKVVSPHFGSISRSSALLTPQPREDTSIILISQIKITATFTQYPLPIRDVTTRNDGVLQQNCRKKDFAYFLSKASMAFERVVRFLLPTGNMREPGRHDLAAVIDLEGWEVGLSPEMFGLLECI